VTYRAFAILLFNWVAVVPIVPAAERVLNQNFSVGPECSVTVDLYRGGIVVEESDEPGVRVSIRLENKLDDERESNRALESVNVESKQEGADRVVVNVRNPVAAAPHFAWRDRSEVEVAVLVSVPRRCNLNLVTVTGSIQVGNLTGAMRARAETGTVSFRHIDGSVNASVAVGDLLVARCSGDATLTASRGNVRVGTIGGRAELNASNGDVEIQNAKAGLRGRVEAGDAIVGLPAGFTGDVDVRTSAGDILVKFEQPAKGVVQASSVWGRVEATVPMTVEAGGAGKSKLSGRINGGGPLLKLHANGGHVRLEAEVPPMEVR
jgi:hypothetical protein